jgi:transposase
MNSTQNDKLMQIKPETLVVGVDVGKNTHYARAFDYRGIELTKLIKFSNTRKGFEGFEGWMRSLMVLNGKTDTIVGFEPTGHYWFALGDFLKSGGYKLGIVNPYHVKCARELDDNSPSKNDHKDPKTIAMLVKDGRYRDVYIPDDLYQELREAVVERERLNEQLTAIQNQVIRWLDIRFPEFNDVFKAWTGKSAMMTLKSFPTPALVVTAGVDEILKTWQKASQKASRRKAEMLVELASASIGRVTGSDAALAALRNLLQQYELIEEQQECIECLMQELLMRVPNASKILEIKGIGVLSAVVIISEIGDISRFKDPRQIIKLAGLNLKEDSSGKHKGKTVISKRGRRRLRESLFRTMIPMLANNPEFRAIHARNTARSLNPMNKMQSIIALCGKLVRVIYAILSKGNNYDSGKLLSDMNLQEKAA